jgi:hypothetical protein
LWRPPDDEKLGQTRVPADMLSTLLGDVATATKPGLIRHLGGAEGQLTEILKVFGRPLIAED